VFVRLQEQRKQLSGETGGTALVLRKDTALRQWEEENKAEKETRALTVKIRATGGYEAGVRAGQSVNLKPHAALGA
jgi:hypothetical protein